jgi:hypothetical protein
VGLSSAQRNWEDPQQLTQQQTMSASVQIWHQRFAGEYIAIRLAGQVRRQ